MKDTQIVRISCQDLDEINNPNIKDFLKNNDLDVLNMVYSSFGACYFAEVKGLLKENTIIEKVGVKPNKFCWNV